MPVIHFGRLFADFLVFDLGEPINAPFLSETTTFAIPHRFDDHDDVVEITLGQKALGGLRMRPDVLRLHCIIQELSVKAKAGLHQVAPGMTGWHALHSTNTCRRQLYPESTTLAIESRRIPVRIRRVRKIRGSLTAAKLLHSQQRDELTEKRQFTVVRAGQASESVEVPTAPQIIRW
jgi:hypothetical protein